MNKEQMIKRAYVRGLAARGIYRARLRQKQAAGGLKDYAISGGIGAAGGSALAALIGGLVQYARGKNVLRGAGIGAGIGAGAGLLGGLGYQYAKGKGKAAIPVSKDFSVYSSNDPDALLAENQYPNLNAVANIAAGDSIRPDNMAPPYADSDTSNIYHLLGENASPADVANVQQMVNANTDKPYNGGDNFNPNDAPESLRKQWAKEYEDYNKPFLTLNDLKALGNKATKAVKSNLGKIIPKEKVKALKRDLAEKGRRRNEDTGRGKMGY